MVQARKQNHKKPRKTEFMEPILYKYYIFCEGECTEPLYFTGFQEAIMTDPIYKNMVQIKVEGVGAETLRVIYAAENYVKEHQLSMGDIWCVYDKDSFPSQNFNAVSERVENLNKDKTNNVTYHVAWSNQCIEYWFILHFDFYDSDNDRKYYREYLHKKFKELGWTQYKKNNKELFNILTEHGDPKLAIKRANQRLESCNGMTDTNSVPATKVNFLVSELAKYLPEKIRARYI